MHRLGHHAWILMLGGWGLGRVCWAQYKPRVAESVVQPPSSHGLLSLCARSERGAKPRLVCSRRQFPVAHAAADNNEDLRCKLLEQTNNSRETDHDWRHRPTVRMAPCFDFCVSLIAHRRRRRSGCQSRGWYQKWARPCQRAEPKRELFLF